jgi:hypothetical protein
MAGEESLLAHHQSHLGNPGLLLVMLRSAAAGSLRFLGVRKVKWRIPRKWMIGVRKGVAKKK